MHGSDAHQEASGRSSSSRADRPRKLELALREQKQTGEKLGSILQRLGICTEKEIARVLASQAGVELRLAGAGVDPARGRAICPERDYAEEHSR
jgi:hypothetical protein